MQSVFGCRIALSKSPCVGKPTAGSLRALVSTLHAPVCAEVSGGTSHGLWSSSSRPTTLTLPRQLFWDPSVVLVCAVVGWGRAWGCTTAFLWSCSISTYVSFGVTPCQTRQLESTAPPQLSEAFVARWDLNNWQGSQQNLSLRGALALLRACEMLLTAVSPLGSQIGLLTLPNQG